MVENEDGHATSYSNISISDQSRVHLGNSYVEKQFVNLHIGTSPDKFSYVKPVGLCLDEAPYMDSSLFVGREGEINQIKNILQPNRVHQEQRRLVLGGMGGIGKTQLAIAFAKDSGDVYESILWLDAASSTTLEASFRSIAARIFTVDDQTLESSQDLTRVKRWLADTKNTKWLLIFDNYDQPDSYDIQKYCPYASHGHVIITTRMPEQVSGVHFNVQPLKNIEHCLKILESRSQRPNLHNDRHARRLAERFEGYPLALATAGAFLSKSTWTCERYVNEYEKRFNINPRRPLQLKEYQDRTLYTTWNMSYQRLQAQDPEAAQMLKLLAYFDNHNIEFKLLTTKKQEDHPEWLKDVLNDTDVFEDVMRTLADCCFINLQPTTMTYSMHSCVHDWTFAYLNTEIDPQSYWYAFDCVTELIESEQGRFFEHICYRSIIPHAVRLAHPRVDLASQKISESRLQNVSKIATLLMAHSWLDASITLHRRRLQATQDIYGADHTLTIHAVEDLGNALFEKGELKSAEDLFSRAFKSNKTLRGTDDEATLKSMSHLGALYIRQGRFIEAESILEEAFRKQEKLLGVDHASTLSTIGWLVIALRYQGKMSESEVILQQLLKSSEFRFGKYAKKTLNARVWLAETNADLGRLTDAADLFGRAMDEAEEHLGKDRTLTIICLYNLISIYRSQHKIQQAQTMRERARQNFDAYIQSSIGREGMDAIGCLFFTCLMLSNPDSLSFKQDLNRLLRLTQRWIHEMPYFFHWIGKAIMLQRDEENARVAFRYLAMMQVSLAEPAEVLFCGGCMEQITLTKGLHICETCEDNHLCDDCVSKYDAGLKGYPKCKDHELMKVEMADLSSAKRYGIETEIDAWLSRLIKESDTAGASPGEIMAEN